MQPADPWPSGWPDIWAGGWKWRWWVLVTVFWQLKMLLGWFKGMSVCTVNVQGLFVVVYVEGKNQYQSSKWYIQESILKKMKWRNSELWIMNLWVCAEIENDFSFLSPHRGALAGWVYRWSTEGQMGDEDAADGCQPWRLAHQAKKQCWFLRLERGQSSCHVRVCLIFLTLWFIRKTAQSLTQSVYAVGMNVFLFIVIFACNVDSYCFKLQI